METAKRTFMGAPTQACSMRGTCSSTGSMCGARNARQILTTPYSAATMEQFILSVRNKTNFILTGTRFLLSNTLKFYLAVRVVVELCIQKRDSELELNTIVQNDIQDVNFNIKIDTNPVITVFIQNINANIFGCE